MQALADLRADTQVTPFAKAPGLYTCHLTDNWSYLRPSGGVLMTVALRAIVAEVAAHGIKGMTLISATTHFCQGLKAGELLIQVQLIRTGNSAMQARASISGRAQPGPGLEVLATLVRDLEGPDVHGITMPEVPRPNEDEVLQSRQEGSVFSFYRNIDVSLAIGDAFWKPGWSAGPAHMGFWYRYRVPQTDVAGILDSLALPPILDTMPPALVRRLGPDHKRYYMPSLDLTVYFMDVAKGEWVLIESFVERARAGYAIGSANAWGEDGKLVARATQSMTLRARNR